MLEFEACIGGLRDEGEWLEFPVAPETDKKAFPIPRPFVSALQRIKNISSGLGNRKIEVLTTGENTQVKVKHELWSDGQEHKVWRDKKGRFAKPPISPSQGQIFVESADLQKKVDPVGKKLGKPGRLMVSAMTLFATLFTPPGTLGGDRSGTIASSPPGQQAPFDPSRSFLGEPAASITQSPLEVAAIVSQQISESKLSELFEDSAYGQIKAAQVGKWLPKVTENVVAQVLAQRNMLMSGLDPATLKDIRFAIQGVLEAGVNHSFDDTISALLRFDPDLDMSYPVLQGEKAFTDWLASDEADRELEEYATQATIEGLQIEAQFARSVRAGLEANPSLYRDILIPKGKTVTTVDEMLRKAGDPLTYNPADDAERLATQLVVNWELYNFMWRRIYPDKPFPISPSEIFDVVAEVKAGGRGSESWRNLLLANHWIPKGWEYRIPTREGINRTFQLAEGDRALALVAGDNISDLAQVEAAEPDPEEVAALEDSEKLLAKLSGEKVGRAFVEEALVFDSEVQTPVLPPEDPKLSDWLLGKFEKLAA